MTDEKFLLWLATACAPRRETYSSEVNLRGPVEVTDGYCFSDISAFDLEVEVAAEGLPRSLTDSSALWDPSLRASSARFVSALL